MHGKMSENDKGRSGIKQNSMQSCEMVKHVAMQAVYT